VPSVSHTRSISYLDCPTILGPIATVNIAQHGDPSRALENPARAKPATTITPPQINSSTNWPKDASKKR